MHRFLPLPDLLPPFLPMSTEPFSSLQHVNFGMVFGISYRGGDCDLEVKLAQASHNHCMSREIQQLLLGCQISFLGAERKEKRSGQHTRNMTDQVSERERELEKLQEMKLSDWTVAPCRLTIGPRTRMNLGFDS